MVHWLLCIFCECVIWHVFWKLPVTFYFLSSFPTSLLYYLYCLLNLEHYFCVVWYDLRILFVLYGCETWSLVLRQEYRLRVSENRLLRGILYLSLRRRMCQRNGEGCAFRSFIIYAICITHFLVSEAEEKTSNHRWKIILMYVRFVVKEWTGFCPLKSGFIGRHLWTQWCCKSRDF